MTPSLLLLLVFALLQLLFVVTFVLVLIGQCSGVVVLDSLSPHLLFNGRLDLVIVVVGAHEVFKLETSDGLIGNKGNQIFQQLSVLNKFSHDGSNSVRAEISEVSLGLWGRSDHSAHSKLEGKVFFSEFELLRVKLGRLTGV